MLLVRELFWVNFLTSLPDILMYVSIFVMFISTMVFLRRLVKQLKQKSFKERIVDKKLVIIISVLYSSYWVVILAWILVRTLVYRDIASPMYLRRELYKYFIPWTFGIFINIATIVYEIYFANFLIIIVDEEKVILMKDKIALESAVIIEDKKLQFYDEDNKEEVVLRLLIPSLKEKFKTIINN